MNRATTILICFDSNRAASERFGSARLSSAAAAFKFMAAIWLGLSPLMGFSATFLSDGVGGMTCHYFASGGRMAWTQSGGDWKDITGKPYGDKPFSVTDLPLALGRQTAVWDVTALARTWQDGAALPGAILLRAIPGTNSGVVNFNSRESEDVFARPELIVERVGGVDAHTQSVPIADAYLPCPTYASQGERRILKVGGDTKTILVFPFDSNDRRAIMRAELRLSTDKVYGRTAFIGVYGPTLPGDGAGVKVGIAAAFPLDKGIENHSDVLFSDRFESPGWMNRWSVYSKKSTTEIVGSEEANRFERLDGKALKVTVPKGRVLGLNAQYRFDRHPAGEPEAMYFRYYLRFGENWNPVLEGGKLPGFAGTYNRGGWGGRRANGVNGWSARGAFSRVQGGNAQERGYRSIGSYVYHADMPEAYGSGWGWNMGPTGMLEKNRWYCVEQYVRLNTPGMKDGVLRAWIDGKLAFDKTDLQYRDVPDLKIEVLWMNVYHGGTRPPAEDLTLYIDNLVIAREYIGPFAGER